VQNPLRHKGERARGYLRPRRIVAAKGAPDVHHAANARTLFCPLADARSATTVVVRPPVGQTSRATSSAPRGYHGRMEAPSAAVARYPLADDASATTSPASQVTGGKYQALRAEHAAALARRRELLRDVRRTLGLLDAIATMRRFGGLAFARPSMPWVRSRGRRSAAGARLLAWRRGVMLLRALDAAERDVARTRRCDARCRDGHRCNAAGRGRGGRCRRHGGCSTGARSAEGRERALAALAAAGAARAAARGGPAAPARVEPPVARLRRLVVALLASRPAGGRRRRRASSWTPADGWNTRARRGRIAEGAAARRLVAIAASRATGGSSPGDGG